MTDRLLDLLALLIIVAALFVLVTITATITGAL